MKFVYQPVAPLVLFLAFFLQTQRHHPRHDRLAALAKVRAELAAGGAQPEDDWFFARRAYPQMSLPDRVASKIRRSATAFRKTRLTAVPQAAASPTWTSVGPTNIGGRITAVLIHPTDPDILYAAAASGGVWKSTDFGLTWANVFNESFSSGALAFDPADPSTIYVGTGESNPSSVDTYPGNGIWRSTDAGATWTNLGLEETGHIAKIAVNPLNPSTIYVAAFGLYRSKNTDKGVYKSTDAGGSWTQILQVDDTTGASDILIDPSDTARVLAATFTYYRTLPTVSRSGPGSGLYMTTNGGALWIQVTGGFPFNDPDIGSISIDWSKSDNAVVYASVAGGGGYNWDGVYKSFDHGFNWSKVYDNSGGFSEGQVWYNNILRIHPDDPNRLWVGMTSMYKSFDGATFGHAGIGGSYHVDHHVIEYAPSDTAKMVFGNDGGVFTSTNGGLTWVKCPNLPVTQFYAGTIAPQNEYHLLGGAQDNSTSRTHTSVPDDWGIIAGGDGFNCLVDPTDSNYIYAEYQNAGLLYSTNGGASFSNGTTGINFAEPVNWQTPIAMDLQHPKTLYTGTNAVYRTTNNMQSWTKISPTLTYGLPGFYSTMSTIDVSRTDSNVVYAGTGDGRVWVTTDGGGGWTEIDSGLPLRWVSRVTADPESANVAYVTLSGFREYDDQGHIYRTTDYGASWTDIGSGLPDIPLNDVLVDPLYPNTLYVASDLNVMRTTDLGATWTEFGDDLPGVTVHDIDIHAGSRTLAAFTHGRSVYTTSLPVIGPGTVDVEVHARWNLISNPVTLGDPRLSTNFPDAVSPAYAYTGGSYAPGDSLLPGRGYWAKFPDVPVSPRTLDGTEIIEITITVEAGWNIIGSMTTPVPAGSITSDPAGMVTSQFYGYSGGYLPSDTVRPGEAYWVKVDSAGTLTLEGGAGATPLNRIRITHTSELPPPPPRPDEAPGGPSVPGGFGLSQNYPNPFNPATRIAYEIPRTGRVGLTVFNTAGRRVAVLVDETQAAGTHSLTFDGTGLPSGLYILRLTHAGTVDVRKMMLLR